MTKITEAELLKIPEVVEEIKRHLWIESEKAGYDIGFERAAKDWIEKYSQGWINYFRPDLLDKKEKDTKTTASVKKNSSCKRATTSTAVSTGTDTKKTTSKKTTTAKKNGAKKNNTTKKTTAKKTTVTIKKRRAKSYSRI